MDHTWLASGILEICMDAKLHARTHARTHALTHARTHTGRDTNMRRSTGDESHAMPFNTMQHFARAWYNQLGVLS